MNSKPCQTDQPAAMAPDIPVDLVRKYSGPGPRYTSYPTAVEFVSDFQNQDWREAVSGDAVSSAESQTNGGQPPSLCLYFHIPFCSKPCYFCACHKVIPKDRSVVEPYLRALEKELASYREHLRPGLLVEQIHWGGGSPDYLTPDEMKRLHETTLEVFGNVASDADVSVELDPRETTKAHLRVLSELGFTRMSFGVQDFDPRVQSLVNRIQPFEMTRESYELAKEFGFSGINIDLIYGLPEQTIAGFSETLGRIIELRPSRIALYGYAHVTWKTKLQKTLEDAHLPTPEERISLFLLALQRLTDAGYKYIGMDHFALPEDSLSRALDDGKLNRNFMGYTTHHGARVLGFGASSISSLPGAYAQNTKDPKEYIQRIDESGLSIERGCLRTGDDQLRGQIIESLLCQGVVDIPGIEKQWNVVFSDKFSESIEKLSLLSEDELVNVGTEQIALTERGRLFSRNAAMAFDAYLEKHQAEKKRVFSQTI